MTCKNQNPLSFLILLYPFYFPDRASQCFEYVPSPHTLTKFKTQAFHLSVPPSLPSYQSRSNPPPLPPELRFRNPPFMSYLFPSPTFLPLLPSIPIILSLCRQWLLRKNRFLVPSESVRRSSPGPIKTSSVHQSPHFGWTVSKSKNCVFLFPQPSPTNPLYHHPQQW